MSPENIFKLVILVGGAVGVLYGAYRWSAPRVRGLIDWFVGMTEAITGRPPMVDRATGKEVSPAVPALGVRLDHFQQGQDRLAIVVTDLTDLIRDQRAQDSRLDDHDQRITTLEQASLERTVVRAESAAMLNLVAQEQAAADSRPDLD